MKRVLLTVHKFFPERKAGTEVLTLKIAQSLIARGYEVRVVCGNPPDADARRKADRTSQTQAPNVIDYVYEGVPVHVIQEDLRLSKNSGFTHEFYHPEIKEHFGQLLDEFKPDILHIVHAQNLSASIIEAATERSIPTVLSATDFWFVCPIVQLIRPSGKVCRGPEIGATNCLTCYTPRLFPKAQEFQSACQEKYPDKAGVVDNLPPPVSKLAWQTLYATYAVGKVGSAVQATVTRPSTLRHLANEIKAIMVPTKLMKDIFIENGINAELIHHVPFGIDTAPLEPYQNKSPSKILRIGYIGTLFDHKGVDLLIEAFQRLPEKTPANLTIYGDLKQFPQYGESLLALAKRSKSDQITFAGTFPNAKFGEVLSGIDVMVVPSRWYENTPLVIQSALATKTPVVATDLGGMSELIKHCQNGLLFKLNDADSLSEQLLSLASKPELLARLRDGIGPERTISQMVDDIESIYNKLVLS